MNHTADRYVNVDFSYNIYIYISQIYIHTLLDKTLTIYRTENKRNYIICMQHLILSTLYHFIICLFSLFLFLLSRWKLMLSFIFYLCLFFVFAPNIHIPVNLLNLQAVSPRQGNHLFICILLLRLQLSVKNKLICISASSIIFFCQHISQHGLTK